MAYNAKLTTITVISTRPLIRHDGRFAIELTAQEGTIALEVDERAVAALQSALRDIQSAMARKAETA